MHWRTKSCSHPLWILLAFSTITFVVGAIPLDQAADPASFPRDRSPRPSLKEWRDAAPLTLTRSVGQSAGRCHAERVREWVRLKCDTLKTAAVRVISGDARDVYFRIQQESGVGQTLPEGVELVLAIRPGDRRIIEFWTFGPGYDGPLTVVGALTFQQYWLDGEDLPRLSLTDTLHEPIRTATAEGK